MSVGENLKIDKLSLLNKNKREKLEEEENKIANETNQLVKVVEQENDSRVDKVYTIGCFDLFHFGHVRLIERMREIGKKVIIGVHDSRRYINENKN